jgi:hypothetical protein
MSSEYTSESQNMSSKETLPQIDLAYDLGKGYDPVSELMRAMILRVIDDYNSGGELKLEALEYMMDEEDEYILSFKSICKSMQFCHVKTRHRIMNPTHKISTRRRAA